MYSEVSDRDRVPLFLSEVFDPQPHEPFGGYGKLDFLKGRSFLDDVQFPGRLELHILIFQLAGLFAVCYERKPTEAEIEQADMLQKIAKSGVYPKVWDAYHGTAAQKYKQWMFDLETHAPTIALFETALRDRSKWPANDFPVKQIYHSKPLSRPITKTGWSTTLFLEGLKIKSDGESDDEDVGQL
jgi:hypothetical protein